MRKIFIYLLLFTSLLSFGQGQFGGVKNFVYVKGTSVLYCDSGLLVKEKYEPEALAYFASMTVQWDATSKGAINTFIKSQKASGLWAKKVRVFLFASTSEGDCVIDLKGTENASLVNSPTYANYRGFTSATGKYVNSNFNPVTDGGTIYTQNSANISIYPNTNLGIGNYDFGAFNGTNGTVLRIRQTTGIGDGFSNTVAANNMSISSVTSSIGLFSTDRSSATVDKIYINGVERGSKTNSNSSALANLDIYIGLYNNNGTPSPATGRQYSYSEFGSSLSNAEALTNYTQINTLLTYILAK